MKDQHIEAFLQAVGTHKAGQTGKWVSASCPLASWRHPKGKDVHPSFGISRGAHTVAKCLNPACGFKSGLFTLVSEIRRLEAKHPTGIKRDIKRALALIEDEPEFEPLIAEADDTAAPTLHVFPEAFLDGFELAYTDTEVHPYLGQRAIDCTTARRWDLRWDGYRQRVCFPLRDYHGQLCGLHGRTVEADIYPTYYFYPWQGHTNVQVWTGEHLVDLDQPLLLVESVFDLARVYPVWPNVMCPRMAGIGAAALKRLDGAKCIYTLFDNDKAGDEARKTVGALKGAVVTHLSVDPHKDPGECSIEFLQEILGNLHDQPLFSIA